MIKAVLFDLDNTLVDFMNIKRACCDAAVSAMINAGLKMKKDEALKALYDVYWKVGIENERIFQHFLEKVNNEIDYKILASGIFAYRKIQRGLQSTYPNVVPTLIKLREKGLKLAIISDAPKLKVWIRLTELGLESFFDVVVASFEDTGERKPSKLPFQKAVKDLKLNPEDVLMIGDWPERDVVGAKQAGIKTCFAKYGWAFQTPPPKEHGADYEIDDIKDLLKIVNDNNNA